MKKVYVATKVRGFLINLFNNPPENIEFIWEPVKIYEVNSRFKLWMATIIKSRIGDYLGIIQRINMKNNDFHIAFSYNRFLKGEKGYILYLENPTAPFHYCIDRNKSIIGKMKVQKYMIDPNLKAIVSISKACHNTKANFYDIPSTVVTRQIYPLIPKNPYVNVEMIKRRSKRDKFKCLYISSNFKLKGGWDIIESFKKINRSGKYDISLRIITRIELIDKRTLDELNNIPNVQICDFKYSKKDLEQIYSETNVLLNPTRQDSFSLVVLEAIKAGNIVLSSDLYAIPEMVVDDYNGYLVAPKYRFFDYDNMPNRQVWNNRNETIHSDYIDENIVQFLYEKLIYLYNNRAEVERLSINAFNKGTTGKFSEEYIKKQWHELIDVIL